MDVCWSCENLYTTQIAIQELQVELKHIGAVVLRFHHSVTQIYEGAVAEAEKRGALGREAGARTQQGKWGLTERDTAAETSRRTRFLEGVVNPADEELAKLDRAFKVSTALPINDLHGLLKIKINPPPPPHTHTLQPS